MQLLQPLVITPLHFIAFSGSNPLATCMAGLTMGCACVKRAKVNPIRAIEVLIKSTFRARLRRRPRLAIVFLCKREREAMVVLNKNKDELVSPPPLHSYSTFKGVHRVLFLLVIPISGAAVAPPSPLFFSDFLWCKIGG